MKWFNTDLLSLLLSTTDHLSLAIKHQTFSTGRRQPEVKSTSDPRFSLTGSALTSPVKRKFRFYDFRAFISFSLLCFVLSIFYRFDDCTSDCQELHSFFHSLKMLSMTSFVIMHNSGTGVWHLQTSDCRLQTGSTRKILLTMTSSSTTFPAAQNNINLVEKILLDFLWWFTLMVLDSR